MKKQIGKCLLLFLIFFSLISLVSATKINLTVPSGAMDGYIYDTGVCGRTTNNVSNLAIVGYDQTSACYPYSASSIRSDYRAYFSFNASSYSLCTINNATLWYYVNGITRLPAKTWSECTQSPELELGRLFNRIGVVLQDSDWDSYGTAIYSLAISPPSVYSGWKSIFIDAGNITTTGMTDVEFRGDDDWYQCMNTTGQKYVWNIRTTEYTGTTYDPVLELDVSNCPTAPTVNITSPLNQTYTSSPIDLNWTYNITTTGQNLSSAWYSLDGGSNVSLLGWSYQEQGDEFACSGDWDVSYPCSNTNDSNWNTYGTCDFAGTCYYYVNYTKPVLANLSSLYNIRSLTKNNISIPLDCFNHHIDKIEYKFILYGSYTTPPNGDSQADLYCKNNTGWHYFYFQDEAEGLYEEAMWWDGIPINTTISPTEGEHRVAVCVNDTNGLWGCNTTSFGLFLKQQIHKRLTLYPNKYKTPYVQLGNNLDFRNSTDLNGEYIILNKSNTKNPIMQLNSKNDILVMQLNKDSTINTPIIKLNSTGEYI